MKSMPERRNFQTMVSNTMEESSVWLILFYHSIVALVDGEGVFIDVPSSSRGAQSFGALYGRQVTQTICVNSMP